MHLLGDNSENKLATISNEQNLSIERETQNI